jgi:hypothetical protein
VANSVPHRFRQSVRRRSHDALERVRHARHPLHGWKKWSLILLQWLALLVVVFALVNLALGLSVQSREDRGRRFVHVATALWFSPLDGQTAVPTAFERLYGDELGRDPDASDIRGYFERRLDGTIVLDQIMTEQLVDRFGGVDARTFPAGVYVGVRALGPDGLPFVPVTKYLAHFLFFPRHAYILVVPETGPAQVFSASLTGHFDADADNEQHLAARIGDYAPGAYDFPSSGQAVHELTLITRDPQETAGALEQLSRAKADLEDAEIDYGVLAPNSNTVIGCILEDAGVMSRAERSSALLAVRAPGVGAACR